jgi:peptidoglycan hydrolase-like protein with peptidoglycan-binding domain
MFQGGKTVRTHLGLVLLATGVLSLSLTPLVAVAETGDVKKLQESLRDKGYDPGPIDGVMGSRTRHAIGQYQTAESLPATGHLNRETAGKLGVGPESEGGEFKGAGKEVGQGGKELGHEMKAGKPVAGAKEMGIGIGRAGKKFGKGMAKAVSPESDRADREKKKQKERKP